MKDDDIGCDEEIATLDDCRELLDSIKNKFQFYKFVSLVIQSVTMYVIMIW